MINLAVGYLFSMSRLNVYPHCTCLPSDALALQGISSLELATAHCKMVTFYIPWKDKAKSYMYLIPFSFRFYRVGFFPCHSFMACCVLGRCLKPPPSVIFIHFHITATTQDISGSEAVTGYT